MQFNIFIGRFQPVHNAHLEIIRGSLEAEWDRSVYGEDNPNNVILCIGSAYASRTPKDPFTWEEREQMIRSAFTKEQNARIFVAPIRDSLYNDTQWANDIQKAVDTIVEQVNVDLPAYIRLVGHKKDESSFYLDMFPQWKFIGISNIDDLHSTTIRDYYFNAKWNERYTDVEIFSYMCQDVLNDNVYQWLLKFRETPEFEQLKEEYNYIQAYKESWAVAPYAPTFVTADAVVVQSGHILMIQRKHAPGKGLYAISGGFVNQNEFIKDAAIRELREETKLKVPVPVLKGSITKEKVYDAPNRSLRGRTITHAFLIELNPGPLPPVKGSDDAKEAFWIPLSQFDKLQDQMFEDHASIIKDMLGI